MKATLDFEMPDDHDEFKLACAAGEMWGVLWELDQWLRTQLKHNPNNWTFSQLDTLIAAREELNNLMEDRNINFDLVG